MLIHENIKIVIDSMVTVAKVNMFLVNCILFMVLDIKYKIKKAVCFFFQDRIAKMNLNVKGIDDKCSDAT